MSDITNGPIPRKRICIIAFKPVRSTVHVLRQIDYLARDYDLTVIGHGEADPSWPALEWRAVPEQDLVSKITKLFWYTGRRLAPALYDTWYWRAERHKLALTYALASGADAIHANDWQALPIAIEAARQTGARVVFHTHEYAEEERTDSRLWRTLVSPAIRYLMRRYTADPTVPIAASITVCEPIAERYQLELGLHPRVVFNAPKPVALPFPTKTPDRKRIRLIHHGYAKRGRGLHRLIEALALTDARFELDFMLVSDDQGYIGELKQLGEQLAPGRVHFREPVRPDDIVRTVSEYDVGFCVIEPSSYNNLMMLPNKFFEYIQAGLAVCVGPSPAMASLVRMHELGVTTETFDPTDVAETLNHLTWQGLERMKRAARKAATVLNADVEMAKIVSLYHDLLRWGPEAQHSSGTENTVIAHQLATEEGLMLPLATTGGNDMRKSHSRTACVVAHSHFPMDPRVRREVEALLSDGWLVDIVCLQDRGEPRSDHWGKARVHRLPITRHRGGSIARYMLEYGSFFLLALAYVTWLGLRRRYDLVQVHNVPDFLVFSAAPLRLLGARVLLDIRDPVPDLYISKYGGNKSHPLVRLMCLLEARSTAFADQVLTPGEPSRQRLIGRDIPAHKLTNILNSPDPTLFAPISAKPTEKRWQGSFTLVYHGGLFERYGLDVAIQAVHKLRDEIPGLRFRIAGYGEERENLQRLINELDLRDRVALVGWVAPSQIREFAADADLGVVPYRQDTFTDLIYPTKAFEYIAMGVPVIMTRLAGVVELFPNVPDLFVRPGDVDDLAARILLLYRDPERTARLNERVQRIFAPYAWAGQRQRYLDLVDDLVAGEVPVAIPGRAH